MSSIYPTLPPVGIKSTPVLKPAVDNQGNSVTAEAPKRAGKSILDRLGSLFSCSNSDRDESQAAPLPPMRQIPPIKLETPLSGQDSAVAADLSPQRLYPDLSKMKPFDSTSTDLILRDIRENTERIRLETERRTLLVRNEVANQAREEFRRSNPMKEDTGPHFWEMPEWNNFRTSVDRNPELAAKILLRPKQRDYDLSVDGQATLRPTKFPAKPKIFGGASAISQPLTAQEKETRRLEAEDRFVERKLSLFDKKMEAKNAKLMKKWEQASSKPAQINASMPHPMRQAARFIPAPPRGVGIAAVQEQKPDAVAIDMPPLSPKTALPPPSDQTSSSRSWMGNIFGSVADSLKYLTGFGSKSSDQEDASSGDSAVASQPLSSPDKPSALSQPPIPLRSSTPPLDASDAPPAPLLVLNAPPLNAPPLINSGVPLGPPPIGLPPPIITTASSASNLQNGGLAAALAGVKLKKAADKSVAADDDQPADFRDGLAAALTNARLKKASDRPLGPPVKPAANGNQPADFRDGLAAALKGVHLKKASDKPALKPAADNDQPQDFQSSLKAALKGGVKLRKTAASQPNAEASQTTTSSDLLSAAFKGVQLRTASSGIVNKRSKKSKAPLSEAQQLRLKMLAKKDDATAPIRAILARRDGVGSGSESESDSEAWS